MVASRSARQSPAGQQQLDRYLKMIAAVPYAISAVDPAVNQSP